MFLVATDNFRRCLINVDSGKIILLMYSLQISDNNEASILKRTKKDINIFENQPLNIKLFLLVMSTVKFTNKSFIRYFTFRKVRSKAPAYSPSKSGYNAKHYEPIPRKRTQLISESLTTQASLFVV